MTKEDCSAYGITNTCTLTHPTEGVHCYLASDR